MPAQNPPARTSTSEFIPVWHANWPRLVCGAILAAGAIAVYGRTFSVPLLFDDTPAIVNNPSIQHWSTALWSKTTSTASGRPILNLSLAINYAISGTAVGSYHAMNLAIHFLAGLTLFGIVRRTLAPRAGAAAALIAFSAALLWTLHPLQTESVTYIVQRAESLMGLFYLLTLYCFIRGAGGEPGGLNCRSLLAGDQRHERSGIACKQAPTTENRTSSRQWRWFALSVAACLLGMATKEVMVSAPLIVLLYDRTFVAGSFREAWRRRRRLHLALAATWVPLIALVAGTGWDRGGTSGLDVGVAPWTYWLTQFQAVTRYLWLSVWPHPLVFEFGPVRVDRWGDVILGALVVVPLAAAVLLALRRWPAWGFAGAWFFLILAPTSVMPGKFQMIVEHRMYLPLAAVMALVAIGIHAAVRRRSWIVFAALALGLGALAARRNEDYQTATALWRDTVAKRPDNERARYNLGAVLAQMPGRQADAIVEYEQAVRLQPDYAEAHNNLGIVLAQMPGRLADAVVHYEAALRLKPDSARAHNNLANALAQMPGRLADAIAEYEQALRLQPDYSEAHSNLGAVLAQMPGRLADAAVHYQAAVRLQPDSARAHNNLGAVLAQMPGRLADAVVHYEAALRLKPDFAEAHDNHGLALAQMPGRLKDAVVEHRAALRLRPDYAPGWHNLGAALYHLGDLPAAAEAFREEVRLSPDDPAARQALAEALRQTAGDKP
jgi:Flp pilus assembly protein TadD